eukprot:6183376-Pleurochrysis_carterae.AAC.2
MSCACKNALFEIRIYRNASTVPVKSATSPSISHAPTASIFANLGVSIRKIHYQHMQSLFTRAPDPFMRQKSHLVSRPNLFASPSGIWMDAQAPFV